MQARKAAAMLMLLAGGWIAAVDAVAQMSLLPPSCAQLSGEALDKCVRDISAPLFVPKIEAVDPPPPDPSQTANCMQVLAADAEYCVWRNEIIIACRDRAKYPDFAECYAKFIPNVKKPVVANCAREKPALRNACASRNAVFTKCLEEPLGYFLCVANKGKLPERTAKP